ncbi:MAG TPA: NPCBM/NEW2 domain-containing protein [Humisphaera sp.]
MPRSLTVFAALLLTAVAARAADVDPRVIAARKVLDAYHAKDPVPADRKLAVVLWTPADREPAPQFRQRLTRVMTDVRGFYFAEMTRLGLGGRTIRLDLAADGLLNVHVVKGAKPYAAYDVKSGSDIRKECLPALRAAGVDPDHATLVIFCNMSNYDPAAGTVNQNSPYYAGGGARGGTAWQVDSPILDADLIGKTEPMVRDGQYGRISVGKYNSIFVGGVCHELGHALGLPHDAERADEKKTMGTSLMGSGNRTYGQDRRGEGKGSFLSLADGLRLASHPMFSGSAKGVDSKANAKLEDVAVAAAEGGKSFSLTARATADVPVYAVVGYMDPAGGDDYDATTAVAVPDAAGKFTLVCDALKAGKPATLRVVVLTANGNGIGDRTFALPYAVAADGTVDLSAYTAAQALAPLAKAVNANDAATAAAELKKLEAAKADAKTLAAARTLAGTLGFKPGAAPAEAAGGACQLSEAAWSAARVGWGKPTVNRLPGDTAVIRVGGTLFARGLYAHAPSAYKWDLGGKWKTLTAKAGVADGFDGSVVFVALGDGKELWRSAKTKGGALLDVKVDVAGVRELELRVENAGDGNNGDWAVWAEPAVSR